MEHGKLWGLNFLWAGWGFAVISEHLTFALGVIGAVTLIWMNIEGIRTHRKNRKNRKK
tara:strand:- start:638 stop:811 length:174 start_codon:yes stop_codon:yes gene_type:complete